VREDLTTAEVVAIGGCSRNEVERAAAYGLLSRRWGRDVRSRERWLWSEATARAWAKDRAIGLAKRRDRA
jgi:hypothetical protein